ncbi:MAG: 4Fe-4S binding protein [Anaerolineaceae bacterium]|nr:4Fe-4S binding protein [Anaerolineaceae bacterium]
MLYFHAQKVVLDKCRGHMTCMRVCPTEAIRVRDWKASISDELCVDCGICISVCPSGAIVPIVDLLSEMSDERFTVAVPDAVLYSQFDPDVHPYIVHQGLKELGFDMVVDVFRASAEITRGMDIHIKNHNGRFPLISSYCPAVVRLIQVKFPDLVEQLIPLDIPREFTAAEIRRSLHKKLNMNPEDIEVIYISPCPAKIVSVKQPAEKVSSWFDSAISIKDIFPFLYPKVINNYENFDETQVPEDFEFTSGWARLGAIIRDLDMENWLAVSGLEQITRIFDDIENSRLKNIEFIEAAACLLGCIGGPFNVETPYVARTNNVKQRQRYEEQIELDAQEVEQKYRNRVYFMENPILPRPTTYYDTDLATSIQKIQKRDRIYKNLKQIDDGLCGAPTCMAFAGDVVRGEAKLTDCIFLSDLWMEEY